MSEFLILWCGLVVGAVLGGIGSWYDAKKFYKKKAEA
jgi:hypothetical protein